MICVVVNPPSPINSPAFGLVIHLHPGFSWILVQQALLNAYCVSTFEGLDWGLGEQEEVTLALRDHTV